LTNVPLLFHFQITTEKLEELKGNIPRAGPKYRLGMYFETIHNLPCFDEVTQYEDNGYTSYWETDTEVDSDFGNFIFNNVSGDSASVICIDDTVDMNALRKRHDEIVAQSQSRPHYKLEQSSSSSSSPSVEHPLERSTEHPLERSTDSKQSKHSHRLRSASEGMCQSPPPVPPPRRPVETVTDPQDHTYETVDDCREDYQTHQIYISKASDDSRGSQDSTAKPVSNDEADLTLSSKQAEGATDRSPAYSKLRSFSLQCPKSPEFINIRQRRKLSEPSPASRKRRQEKVGSKVPAYPPPVKGFPLSPEDSTECLTMSFSSERRSPMCAPSTNALPNQRGSTNTDSPKMRKTSPLVIKHKGKTYLVPVVDKKLEKELEKRSKAGNSAVTMRQAVMRTNSNSTAPHTMQNHRSFASAPKTDVTDQAAPHRRRNSSNSKSSPQRAPSKQVTHYGVL
jgi:hypothetical protein